MKPVPQRPSCLSPYAEACLLALVERGLAQTISIGEASGLLHYLDYRTTQDVDAWWSGDATAEQREEVVRTLRTALERFGQVVMRRWGDVVSVEPVVERKSVFSFRIARRAAQLAPSTPAPWLPVLPDSLADLVAGKMVALVDSGALRDFRDIHALCRAGLTSPAECWDLWRQRQRLSGSDTSAVRAELAITTHLARIARLRPLVGIADAAERAGAEGHQEMQHNLDDSRRRRARWGRGVARVVCGRVSPCPAILISSTRRFTRRAMPPMRLTRSKHAWTSWRASARRGISASFRI